MVVTKHGRRLQWQTKFIGSIYDGKEQSNNIEARSRTKPQNADVRQIHLKGRLKFQDQTVF